MTEEQEILTMKRHEIRRLHLIEKVIKGEVRQIEAAEVLGLSSRQVRRLVRRVEQKGEKGIIHGLRGQKSNRRLSEDLRLKIIKLYLRRYEGFGPTLAVENLKEHHKITISKETLRRWLIDEDLWCLKREYRKRHRQWRERKKFYGQMVQMDGSHHDWLEGRGPMLVLMAQIDDATNRVAARFYEYEGTIPALDSFKRYIGIHGIPSSVYLDRHTTYKSKGLPTVEEELAGHGALSQFQRVCIKLGVEVIHANSPQAKGRIERLFRTLQDRLVKELRLKGAKTLEEANCVLEVFLEDFNERFSVEAQEKTNMHQKVKGINLEEIFSIETTRYLRNDNTVAHNKQWYQLLNPPRVKDVLVRDRLDGQVSMWAKGRRLEYKRIAKPAPKEVVSKIRTATRRSAPVTDHPWRLAQTKGRRLKELNQKRTLLLC